jgi:hypothetical protein
MFVLLRPSGAHRQRLLRARCTSNARAPTLDVMFTGVQVARTLIAVNASDQDYQGMTLPRGGDIGLGVALTLLGVTAASAARAARR